MLLGLLAGSTWHADAATPRSLSLSGPNGTAFAVTVASGWRLDFGHMTVSGGTRYEGVALELLGRPARDGLGTIAAQLPDSPHAVAGARIHAFGAVDAHGLSVLMPAGHYLMVLIGDHPVHVSIPLRDATRVTTVSKVKTHNVRFVETSTTVAFSPAAPALYAGQLNLRLPLARDPLVMTHLATTFPPGTQTFDLTECVRPTPSACPSEADPTFGLNNTSLDGEAVQTEDYYDGADGLSSLCAWYDRAAVRGSHPGATLYGAAVVVDGANR